MKVAVLGASPNRERYSNICVRRLLAAGFDVVPVNPAHETIEGVRAVASLEALDAPVHTITVYVGPKNIGPLIESIVAKRPDRVILNPGAESPELEERLRKEGIPYVEACTLVMLSAGEF